MPAPKKRAPTKKPTPRRRSPIPPEDRPLTAKQALFVRWYCSDIVNCNGVQAAVRAGYKGNYNTLAAMASETLKKPNVAKAVKETLAQASAQADVTVESTLRKLTEIRERALEAGQLAPAARCAELQGKYLKMFTDRIEHTATLDDVSMDDLINLLKEITTGAGIDISKLLAGHGSGHRDGAHPAGDPPAN